MRQISSNISADVSAESNDYLKTKTKYLKPQGLYVNVQLDKIHIRPCVTYKNGRLTGTNKEGETATSISSLLSNNKDVVALLPTKKITAEKLCSLLKSVLKTVTSSGYSVISIITDGNRINEKMFHLIAGCPSTTHLPVYITNLYNQERPIFLLFDLVHILKCIRNNWINLKNYKKAFSFPDFEDNEKILRASFADLETIYLLETSLTLKKAPALSWKALHPHALKRQSVKLALKVFLNTTAAVLNCFGP